MGGNMKNMMKAAQKMQERMAKMQEELAEKAVTASVGGGMVKAVVTGAKVLTSIEIKPEAVDADDMEMLQDLIVAAVNEAMRMADEMASSEMAKFTAGLKLPPGLF